LPEKAEINSRFSKQWLWTGAGLLSWVVALGAWLNTHSPWAARNTLMSLSPQFLWLGFALLITGLLVCRDDIRLLLGRFSRSEWLGMLGVAILAFALVQGVARPIHRIFYDEDIYEAIGLNIAHNNIASMTHEGRWNYGHFDSLRREYNKEPNGWPFLLNIAYRVFGPSETASFQLTHILFAVSCLLIFLTTAMLFKNPIAGLYAAATYALIPENVRWFSTAAVEPAAAAMSLFAMTAALFFFQTRTNRAFFLMTVSWAFAAQFRPESIELVLLIALIFYLDGWEECKTPRLYGFLLLFLVLISAHLIHLYAMSGESWGSSNAKFSLQYIAHNFRTNTLYYLDNQRFPLIFTLLAAAGMAGSVQWKSKFYIAVWFALSWGIFLLFYAGSYEFGADVRFAIPSMAPLAILAGHGLWQLQERLKLKFAWLGHSIAILLFGFNLLTFLPFMRAEGQESWQCREDHDAARYFATLIPHDGIVLTHNPNMFQIWGTNAAQMSLFKENAQSAPATILSAFPGRVYVHWNYWCNMPDPLQNGFMTYIFDHYRLEQVAKWPGRERFELYRVIGPISAFAAPNKPARRLDPQQITK
jgi:hypothetical protein